MFHEPMLAKTMTKRSSRFPALAQPKIDGVRAMWDGHTAWTRTGHRHLPHVNALFAGVTIPEGALLLDGELIVPGARHFEQTQSAVTCAETADGLKFLAFDCICREAAVPCRDRLAMIDTPLESTWVHNATEIESVLDRFTADGYEGIILRDPRAPYCPGRTTALQKYKRFQDAEFPILTVIEAGGKDAGTAVFVCCTRTNRTFTARPIGTRAHRARLWVERASLVGCMATVRFQGLSSYGVPRFPVAIAVRPIANA